VVEWLLSWEVVSVVSVALAAAGQGFIGLEDFKLAKLCFLLAAADAIGGMVMWGIKTDVPPWMRIGIVFVSIGLIGVLAVQSFRYVDRKEEKKRSADPDIVAKRKDLYIKLQREKETRIQLISDHYVAFLQNELWQVISQEPNFTKFPRQRSIILEELPKATKRIDETREKFLREDQEYAALLAEIEMAFPPDQGIGKLVDNAKKKPTHTILRPKGGIPNDAIKEQWISNEGEQIDHMVGGNRT